MVSADSVFHRQLKLAMNRMNQSELARRSGVAQSAINRVVGGGDPSLSSLIAIAKALDVTVGFLVGEGQRDPMASHVDRPLEEIEAAMEAEQEWPLPPQRQAALADIGERARTIALDEAMPDPVRAHADRILRLAFDDAGAKKRDAARHRRLAMEQKARNIMVEDVLSVSGWDPSPEIRMALYQLVTLHDVSSDSLHFLIAALRQQFKLPEAD